MKIDLNSAPVTQLTQLPGISKTLAYRIVNHRQRHGEMTSWEELKEIKDFPAERLAEIQTRATLACSEPGCAPPRHLETHLEEVRKHPSGFTRKLRATRGPQRSHDPASHRPH